ncbi:MAG: hypothetical protein ABII90_06040 [Bacteroidota bacterium]
MTNTNREKEFLLISPDSFVEIKKIILTPLFSWVKPDEWSTKLVNQGLYFKITCNNNRGVSFSQEYTLMAFVSPYYFQPVFTLNNPINIPLSVKSRAPNLNEFPIKIKVKLFGAVLTFDFDIMFIYDEV